MADYGFMALDVPFDQSSGFFVDENNRILYWPRREGPGYVLEEEKFLRLAQRLLAIKKRELKWAVLRLILFVGWGLFVSISTPLFAIILRGEADITFNAAWLVIFLLGPFLVWGVWKLGLYVIRMYRGSLYLYDNQWFEEELESSRRTTLLKPSPKEIYKHGERMLLLLWLSSFSPLAIFMMFGLYGYFVSDFADFIWFIYVLGFMGFQFGAISFAGWAVFAFVIGRGGFSVEARLYKFRNGENNLNTGARIIRTPKFVPYGRRGLFSALLLISITTYGLFFTTFGGAMFVHQQNVGIINHWTYDDLVERSLRIGIVDREVIETPDLFLKWDENITVYLQKNIPNDLKTNLQEQFSQFSCVIGYSIKLVGSEHEAKVKILLDPNKVSNSDGSPASIVRNLNFRIKEDFLQRLEMHLDERVVRNHENFRRASIALVFKMLGMLGTYEYGASRYSDAEKRSVRVPLALASVFYDSRIKPRMSDDQFERNVKQIVSDMMSYGSFASWLDFRANKQNRIPCDRSSFF